MIRESGSFEVELPPVTTHALLMDPAFVVSTVPEVQSFEISGPRELLAVVKVGVSFIKGAMRLKIDLAPQRDLGLQVAAQGSGLGSSVDMQIRVQITAGAAGTTVVWEGEARIGGRLASVSGGILDKVARKNIITTLANIQKRLAERGIAEVGI